MSKPLSKSLKRFFGVGDLGFAFMTSMQMSFFAAFLTDYAMFPLALAGAIMTITSTIDTIFAPMPGIIIDRSNFKWGRYRSWLLIGPPLVVLLHPFQYTKIGSDMTAAIIISVSFILSHIIWNIFWVSNLSLISVLANSPADRMLLSSRRTQYQSVSRILFSYIGLPLILFFGRVTNNQIMGFTITSALMASLAMIGYWVVFRITDGYEETRATRSQTEAKRTAAKTSFNEMVKVILENPPLLVHMFVDFCAGVGRNMLTALAFYYYRYTVNMVSLMSLHLLLLAIASLLGALFVPYFAKFVRDTKKQYMFYSSAMAVCLVAAGFIGGSSVYAFMAFCTLSSFFQQSSMATNPLMYSNTIVYSEWKTGHKLAGLIMGFSNLPLKAGIIMRGVVVAGGLGYLGFVANQDPTPRLANGIVALMTFAPAALLLFSTVISGVFYKLDDERVVEMQLEIDSRSAVIDG
jgi:GPH family glycoside/pentoside/hexuronide:cation symporter